MNQRHTAMADIFTRLGEQAAGTAAAIQPTHAPFFAPLRDVDLPSPASVTTGAEQATLSPPTGQRGPYPAASPLWFDPLVAPDPAWADRPVPTLGWLASTVPIDAVVSPADESAAVTPTMPAVGDQELGEAEDLRRSEERAALTPMAAAATPASVATTSTAVLPPIAPPPGLPGLGTIQLPSDSIERDNGEVTNSRAPAHGSASQTMQAGTTDGRAASALEGLLPVAEDTHRPDPDQASPTATHRFPDTSQPGDMPSVMPAAPTSSHMPVKPDLSVPLDEAVGASVRPAKAPLQPPSRPAEGQLPAISVEAQPPSSETSRTAEAAPSPPTVDAQYARVSSTTPAGDARPVSPQQTPDLTQSVDPSGSLSGSLSPQPGPQQPEGERRVHRTDETIPANIAPVLTPRSTPTIEHAGKQHSLRPASDADSRHQAGLSSADVSATASAQPILSQRTDETPDSTGAAGRTVPALQAQTAEEESQHLTVRQQASQPTPAVPPGPELGGPSAMPEAPPSEEYVSPRYAQPRQKSQQVQASAEIATARNQAPVAEPTNTAASSPDETLTRDGAPIQAMPARDIALPANPPIVQPAASAQPTLAQSAGQDDALQGDTSPVRSALVSDSAGVMRPEFNATAQPHTARHVEAIRQVEPARTPDSPEVARRTHITPAGTSPAPSVASPVQTPAALPVAAPRAHADTMSAIASSSASVPLQQRVGALATRPTAQPLPAAQTSIEPPAVQPRLAQAAGTPAAASPPGRRVELETRPTVHITIGRVEVRYAAPRAVPPPARPPSRQNLPLDTILQRDVWEVA